MADVRWPLPRALPHCDPLRPWALSRAEGQEKGQGPSTAGLVQAEHPGGGWQAGMGPPGRGRSWDWPWHRALEPWPHCTAPQHRCRKTRSCRKACVPSAQPCLPASDAHLHSQSPPSHRAEESPPRVTLGRLPVKLGFQEKPSRPSRAGAGGIVQVAEGSGVQVEELTRGGAHPGVQSWGGALGIPRPRLSGSPLWGRRGRNLGFPPVSTLHTSHSTLRPGSPAHGL